MPGSTDPSAPNKITWSPTLYIVLPVLLVCLAFVFGVLGYNWLSSILTLRFTYPDWGCSLGPSSAWIGRASLTSTLPCPTCLQMQDRQSPGPYLCPPSSTPTFTGAASLAQNQLHMPATVKALTVAHLQAAAYLQMQGCLIQHQPQPPLPSSAIYICREPLLSPTRSTRTMARPPSTPMVSRGFPVLVDAVAAFRVSRSMASGQGGLGFIVGEDGHISSAYPYGVQEALPPGGGAAYHAYSEAVLKHIREVNGDAQCVGWYMTTNMGKFVDARFIDMQLYYQTVVNEKSVALVFDTARSSNGALSLKAYSLSPAFVAAHKANGFTTEALQKSGLRYQDILIEHPVSLHNSHLVTSYLHSRDSTSQSTTAFNSQTSDKELATLTLSDLTDDRFPVSQELDNDSPLLALSIDPYLQRLSDALLDSIEDHTTEQNNHQYWQRALNREQAKITAWQAKRKSENALRAQSKQPPLDENEWQRLFKLPQEPSKLDSLLIGRQIEQYARQIDSFTATASTKMFAAREVL